MWAKLVATDLKHIKVNAQARDRLRKKVKQRMHEIESDRVHEVVNKIN